MPDNILLPPQTDQTTEIDPNKDYFSELVGEGKKYKDQGALAYANMHGSQTIELMKRRLDELQADNKLLRDDNLAKAKLEDLINQLSSTSSNDRTPAKDDNPPPPQFDLTKIDELVANKIAQTERARQEQANLSQVQSKLIEQLGPNYSQHVQRKLEAIGLTSDDFHNLAKKSPAALYETLGMNQRSVTDLSVPRSQQRSDNFAPVTAPKRTWAYYQNLKKTDPNLYFDRKTAVQMQEDAIQLGETFRDGDYYRRGLHDS